MCSKLLSPMADNRHKSQCVQKSHVVYNELYHFPKTSASTITHTTKKTHNFTVFSEPGFQWDFFLCNNTSVYDDLVQLVCPCFKTYLFIHVVECLIALGRTEHNLVRARHFLRLLSSCSRTHVFAIIYEPVENKSCGAWLGWPGCSLAGLLGCLAGCCLVSPKVLPNGID